MSWVPDSVNQRYYHIVGWMCVERGLHPKHVLAEPKEHLPLLREIAIELRRAGASYAEIAHCLGYDRHSKVWHLVNYPRKGFRK